MERMKREKLCLSHTQFDQAPYSLDSSSSFAYASPYGFTHDHMVQVEARMQELKAAKQSPFTLDKEWLQQHPPALLLTQHACRACDVHSSQVAQVIVPLLPCCTLTALAAHPAHVASLCCPQQPACPGVLLR